MQEIDFNKKGVCLPDEVTNQEQYEQYLKDIGYHKSISIGENSDITNLEIIQLETIEGNLVATLSYQDTRVKDSVTNGYGTVDVPINIRELQVSDRGNVLVDQSVKTHSTSKTED